jgi:hypothetical protein
MMGAERLYFRHPNSQWMNYLLILVGDDGKEKAANWLDMIRIVGRRSAISIHLDISHTGYSAILSGAKNMVGGQSSSGVIEGNNTDTFRLSGCLTMIATVIIFRTLRFVKR